MKAANRTQLKEIFEAALDLPLSRRADLLAARCAGDDRLRADIERLLAADDAAKGFLESSPFDGDTDLFAEFRHPAFVGKTIDAYHIEREIGAGGMGAVYLAERSVGDVRQKVAIKIVHQGANSKEIARRFLIERKILAGLEHAGIARMIDAGETSDRLPYIAMEYVAGKPLDEYCQVKDLSIAERLPLFQKVCEAVAYAHRRLVIHRDLKPTNILVSADGEPKLLDFGIAKLLAPVDAEIPRTATVMNLLTPAYAAPEQILGESVTTATDVYSLGVILYELLTGIRPYSFGDKNYPEIVRIICETEPPKPSEAETQESKRPATGENRGPWAGSASIGRRKTNFNRSLRGDLDNIVLKALRKDPERRYQSVEQLSEDISRYLKGLPIAARPDTFSYRTSKFLERNRLAVIATSLIFLLLVAGIFGTTWQAIRAERQKKIAEKRFGQVRELANNVIFKYHDSIANLNGSTDVRKMLVEDASKYLDELSQDSGSDEDLQNELALAYSKLADVEGKPYYANTGDTADAIVNYQKSIRLLESLAGSDISSNSLRAEEELIGTYHSYSSLNSRILNFDQAISAQSKSLDLAQKYLSVDPNDLKRRLTFARTKLWLGDVYAESGNFSEAVDRYRDLILLAEETYSVAPNDKDAQTILGVSHDRLGRQFLLRGQELERTDFSRKEISRIYQESSEHLAKTLELFKKVADENPNDQKYRRNYAVALSNYGMALRNVGELDRSLELLRKASADSDTDLRTDTANHEAATTHAEDLHQLGLTLNAGSQTVQAEGDLRSAIKILDKLIEGDGKNMELRRSRLEMESDLGNMMLKNDVDAALKIFQNALDQPQTGERTTDAAFSMYAAGLMNQNIGDCYAQMARRSSAKTRAAEQEQNLDRSETYYQLAVNSWLDPDVRRKYLSRTPELLEFLIRKRSGAG